MSESATATIPLITPLAAHLAAAVKPPRLVEYRCVQTPWELDAPATETAALALGAGVHDLGWMRRVAIRGEDRFRWLSGMVSNTVNDIPSNGGAWNLVLNAQGRIQGDLTTWREGETLLVEIAADQYARLLAHLEHFIVMDDVELVPLGQETPETAIGLTGPKANEVLERVGLPTLSEAMTGTTVEWNGWRLRIVRGYGALGAHYEFFLPAAGLSKLWSCLRTAGADPVGARALEEFRVAEGIPAYGVDIMERDLPQETSQTRALHFNKGCYMGQEIVERIRSRGNVHRHLRSLELSGPVPKPGAELTIGGTAAGRITSVAELALPKGRRVFALAMLRSEAEGGSEPLAYRAGTEEGTAKIVSVPPTLN
jgi:folate-binding protein YgfZ